MYSLVFPTLSLVFSCFCMFSPDSPCYSVFFSTFSLVFPCFSMFYPWLSLFFRVFLCSLIVPVSPCFYTFPPVFLCFSLILPVFPCFSMFSLILLVSPCFPVFSCVFPCFSKFKPNISDILNCKNVVITTPIVSGHLSKIAQNSF